jgi:hypothetical protein
MLYLSVISGFSQCLLAAKERHPGKTKVKRIFTTEGTEVFVGANSFARRCRYLDSLVRMNSHLQLRINNINNLFSVSSVVNSF